MKKTSQTHINVKKIVFDSERGQPELVLADGTKRVIQLMPTGNCWVEYWVTPEARQKSEDDAKRRDDERQAAARERQLLESTKKRPWWKF